MNKINFMTNIYQFPSSIETTFSGKNSASKQMASFTNSTFNDLFSTFISDMKATSDASEGINFPEDTLTTAIVSMFTKIFGEETTTGLISKNSPQGNPVNGVLTQTSHEGHVALDFGVPVGSNVKTTMDGKVTYAGWNNEGYGNLVIVDNGTYKTYYAHLSSIPVKVGQIVNEGEIVGISGNTGNSTGPHLHYEIRKNGVAINPLTMIG
jgi:murein DD-endopeptidase MepM/ murein hydrolase activator NlpD